MTDGPEIIPNETRQMGHSKVPTWKLQFRYAQFSVNLTGGLGWHSEIQLKRLKV